MESLLADGPQPVLGTAGATLAGFLMVAALVLRHRTSRYGGTVVAVFLADVSSVLRVLAVAVGVVSAALAFGFEGVGHPLWLVVAFMAAAVAGALLIWRWRASLPASARQRRLTPTGTPERDIASTAWEIGIVTGGGLGLLTYLVTADHRFGHPPHWTLAVIGALVGYAVGIAAVTPRFRFLSPVRNRSE